MVFCPALLVVICLQPDWSDEKHHMEFVFIVDLTEVYCWLRFSFTVVLWFLT